MRLVWTIEFTEHANKQLKRLDVHIRTRILQWLNERVLSGANPRLWGKRNKIYHWRCLLLLVILVNSVGMLFPLLTSTFSPYYASIAKHMVLTHNWTDLILSNQPWMDKPHLPFWATALSFSIFGINSFSYILPGFLFYLLGIYYTYRLACLWYGKDVALLAALIMASTLHLMLSAIDVRAEAYLLGEIMPACYYWLKYERKTKLKYLLLGALFTALALMTKGLFTLVTVTSGLIAIWFSKREYSKLISVKWLGALILSLVLITPELIALHQQFDLHPAVKVFGHMHISALRWYFWDSQFGRFFNTGPIISASPLPLHYLFFVHTFLWANLPWCLVFIAALYQLIVSKAYRKIDSIYFLSSFFITFILFSLTKFQVDHYTNIIFPFASIISANYLYQEVVLSEQNRAKIIFYVQIVIALLLVILTAILSTLLLHGGIAIIIRCILAIALVYFLYLLPIKRSWQQMTIVYPVITISIAFIFVMFVNGINYAKYDVGYQMANYFNELTVSDNATKDYQIVGYNLPTDLLSLDFHLHRAYEPLSYLSELQALSHKQNIQFYLVIPNTDLQLVMKMFYHAQIKVVKNFAGTNISTYITMLGNATKLNSQLKQYIVLLITL